MLERQGYRTTALDSGEAALTWLERDTPDIILLDVVLATMDGFAVCREIRKIDALKCVPVIFVTGTHDQETICECYQSGGDDYLGKPIRDYELLAKITLQTRMQKQSQVIHEIEDENMSLGRYLLYGESAAAEYFRAIITVDAKMHQIFKYIDSISRSSRPVLVTGETGVGKESIAAAIHNRSGRKGRLVTINVAGLDDNLFSDTLFGHEKGAYTGADNARMGLIEKAAGGTLFLDEIGDLRPESQVKLLRLLQEGEYYPLGADRRKLSDARIVVATNRDLDGMMGEGKFREDLVYRLRTHRIHVPPLRERKNDLHLLVNHFVAAASKELKCSQPKVSDALVPVLSRYNFPGNIRELESIIFDSVSRSGGKMLTPDMFPECSTGDPPLPEAQEVPEASDLQLETLFDNRFPTLKEANDYVIQAALTRANGNQTVAASILGMTRQALHRRLTRRKERE